jgi:hypothetical protein
VDYNYRFTIVAYLIALSEATKTSSKASAYSILDLFRVFRPEEMIDPEKKGAAGEFMVKCHLFFHLGWRCYRFHHHVTIPFRKGTTQIDHIVLSRYGIFVIETKYLSGRIEGGVEDNLWTTQRYLFQNPINQNAKHKQAVEEHAGIAPEFVHSIIVFVGDEVEFKNSLPTRAIAR